MAVILAGGNAPAIHYVSCESCELDPLWAAAQRFLLANALLAVVAGAWLGGVYIGALKRPGDHDHGRS